MRPLGLVGMTRKQEKRLSQATLARQSPVLQGGGQPPTFVIPGLTGNPIKGFSRSQG